MSDYFDARSDCPAIRKAQKAFVESFLEDLMPPLRLAARGSGYALAVHGSLMRDIDMVAIPWTANADKAEELVDRLVGVISGLTGNATASKNWADKPHGRRAVLIYTAGTPEIDLSIMPVIKPEKEKP